MKPTAERPFANPETAARKLIEIANAVEPVQDGRIYMRARFARVEFFAKTSSGPNRVGADAA